MITYVSNAVTTDDDVKTVHIVWQVFIIELRVYNPSYLALKLKSVLVFKYTALASLDPEKLIGHPVGHIPVIYTMVLLPLTWSHQVDFIYT